MTLSIKTIKAKITLFIYLTVLIILIAGIGLGYFSGYNLMRNLVGEFRVKTVNSLASSINEMLDEKIAGIQVYLTDPEYLEMIEKANKRYVGMKPDAIKKYMVDKDKVWIEGKDSAPFIKSYLENNVSVELKRLVKMDKDIDEIFITDRFGGLVVSSGMTSDFYQADEKWWRNAYAGGKGKIYIGDIEFDKSADVWAITFAFPVKDGEGNVVGIAKSVSDIRIFFSPLITFKIGETGHAALVQRDGYILFHPRLEAMSMKFTDDAQFQKLLTDKKKWVIAEIPHMHTEKLFIAYAQVKNPILQEEGVDWWVFIDQDAAEVFAPLHKLILQATLLAPFLILLTVPLGFVFGEVLVKPIRKLHKATERIADGDLNYKVSTDARDEIGQLSRAFDKMMDDLKKSTVSISDLNKEINRRKEVEKKIVDLAKFPSENPAPIMRVSKSGKILYANKAGLEFLNNCWNCKVGQELPDHCNLLVSESFSSNQSKLIECECKGRVFSFRITPVKASGYANIYGEDITERKKAEQELKTTNNFNTALLESIPFGIDIVDETGTIRFMNKKWLSIFGKDYVSKKCWELYRDEKTQCKHCPLKSGIMIGETKTIEADSVLGGKIVEITHTGMWHEGKKAVLEIFQDVTARKKAERVLQNTKNELEAQSRGLQKANEGIKLLYKELEEKNKALEKLDQLKSDFISTVSHELRTPLSITKEGISLVLDKVTGEINEKQAKILGTSKDSIDRLARIINDLLDVSKIEAGKIELKKVLLDLSSLIKKIGVMWKIEAEKNSQTLHISVPDLPVNIYVDPDKFNQIINNLISNAIKYTPEKGKIKLMLKDKKNSAEISVADNGIGIPKEEHSKVFGKFQQFDRVAGPGAKGTGLGLSIVKQLVEMHKGNIKFESEAKKGSKFIFSIPKITSEDVFKEYIANGLKEAEGKKVPFSLIVMNIVKFGDIQKKLGEEATNNLLKDIEQVTKDSLRRRADAVVRDAGNLMVLLFDTRKGDVAVVRKRVEEALSTYFSGKKEKSIKNIEIAYGNATYPDEAANDEELLQKAKKAVEVKETKGA